MKRSKAAEIRKSFKIVSRLEPVQTGSKLVFNSTRIDGKHCFCCPSLASTAWVQSTLSSLCQLCSDQGRRQISATPKEILGDAKNLTWGHWGRNKEHWFRLGLPQERTQAFQCCAAVIFVPRSFLQEVFDGAPSSTESQVRFYKVGAPDYHSHQPILYSQHMFV